MRSLTKLWLFALCSVLALSPINTNAETGIERVLVEGTSLTVSLTDESVLTGPDLIGFSFTVAGEQKAAEEIRIDGAQPDNSLGGVHWLYDLKTLDAAGDWVPYCDTGPDGLLLGFPVAGWMDAAGMFQTSGETIMFTCTSGAIAKCIRMGYSPWN